MKIRKAIKIIRIFLRKLKTSLLCDPAMSHLGIYAKEVKSAYERDNCAAIVITIQLKILKMWSQPKCPSTADCTKKCDIHTKVSHSKK